MRQGLRPAPAFRDRSGYAMACGIVRSLEKKLVSDERLEELIEARSANEMGVLLARWDWIPRELHSRDLSLEEMLRASQAAAGRRLLALSEGSAATRLFLMRFEMQNLAAALAARAAGRKNPPVHREGISSPSLLEEVAVRRSFHVYPEALAGALQKATPLSGRAEQPRGDTVLAAWHEAQLSAVAAERSELLRDYLRHRTDLANIDSRLRALRFPSARGGAPMLPGGMLGEDELERAGSSDALGSILGRTVYGELFAASREDDGEVRLRRLARLADDFLTEVMQPAKHVALGPEPIWGYAHARRVDELNIRAIAFAARGAGGADLAGRKLRKPYV